MWPPGSLGRIKMVACPQITMVLATSASGMGGKTQPEWAAKPSEKPMVRCPADERHEGSRLLWPPGVEDDVLVVGFCSNRREVSNCV